MPRDPILEARKAIEGTPPYSGLGARSANEYFPSISIPHARLRTEEDHSSVDISLTIGGRYSDNVIEMDVPFYVAGMSYGSLKLPAKIALHLALNRLAQEGLTIAMDTGEGGALPWEIYGTEKGRSQITKTVWESVRDYTDRLLRAHKLERFEFDELFHREYPLIVQYASGRFWKPPGYLLNPDGILIKIGQGAKIGHGGLLPGVKVTELVAENRGIPPYKAAHSPSRHLDILGPEDLVAKVLELRELTGWKVPIIVKVGASRVYDDMEIILKSYADAGAVDGLVGGTGAAPVEIRETIGINTVPAAGIAHRAIQDYYSHHPEDGFKYLAHGGVWDSGRIAKTIALGADGIGIGTGFMLAMEPQCTLVQECNTNTCPSGITGSYERLDVRMSADGIVNYVIGTAHELRNITGSLRRRSIHELSRGDLVAGDELTAIATGLPMANGMTYSASIRGRIEVATNELELHKLAEELFKDG